ncbi:lithostathine-like [Gracilinanus agilis]|uniref:lithostathine-like n=1 Tax=Gracilinanus agilis TaxID=191870 RepID=UPI001CFE69DE|nr:lithostathine-like [Gracilinanus agilis]
MVFRASLQVGASTQDFKGWVKGAVVLAMARFKVKLSPMMAPTLSGLFFTCLLLPGLIQGQEDAADAPSARSSCPEGFAFHGSHCYGLLGVINNETWNSAELLCQVHPSGHLVSLLNKAEADFVTTMIKEYPGVQSPIWIGLHDPNKNRRWRWSSNALFLYQAWETGFPNKSSPSYCVSLSFESGFHSWRDEPCEKKYPYVCKFKA